MSNSRPKSCANIYIHGRLKNETEMEAERERIIKMRFDELLKECEPLTKHKVDYIKKLVGDVDVGETYLAAPDQQQAQRVGEDDSRDKMSDDTLCKFCTRALQDCRHVHNSFALEDGHKVVVECEGFMDFRYA